MHRVLSFLFAVSLFALLAVPAAAETDTFARAKLNKHDKRIATLETQVQALTTLVESLQSENAALKAKADSNLALIKALAKRLPAQ